MDFQKDVRLRQHSSTQARVQEARTGEKRKKRHIVYQDVQNIHVPRPSDERRTKNDRYFGSHERNFCKKKEVSDFLVIGYLYLEINCNFIYVTSFCSIQLKLSSVIGIG